MRPIIFFANFAGCANALNCATTAPKFKRIGALRGAPQRRA